MPNFNEAIRVYRLPPIQPAEIREALRREWKACEPPS
jgi:hypothetical protein